MNLPVVSVILTVYKRTEFLDEAIRSVLNQTFREFELIVTDDAPSEAAAQICSEHASDGRVRYRRNDRTLGAPLNVAAALREARGNYITILNDDDLLFPQMLEQLLHPLEQNPNLVLSFGNHTVINQDGEHLQFESAHFMRQKGREGLLPGIINKPLDFVVRGGLMVVMGCVFRREFSDPDWLAPETVGAYDYWLAVKLAAKGSFYFVPEAVMSWRNHADSVSAKPNANRIRTADFIFNSLSEIPLSTELRSFVCQRLAYDLYWHGHDLLLNGLNRSEAQRVFWRALKLHPSLRLFGAWVLTFMPSFLRRLALKAWLHTRPLRKTPNT